MSKPCLHYTVNSKCTTCIIHSKNEMGGNVRGKKDNEWATMYGKGLESPLANFTISISSP